MDSGNMHVETITNKVFIYFEGATNLLLFKMLQNNVVWFQNIRGNKQRVLWERQIMAISEICKEFFSTYVDGFYILWRNVLSVCQSMYSSIALLDLSPFFSFLILYAVGGSPWTRDQPVRPLPTKNNTCRIKAHHAVPAWRKHATIFIFV